MHVLKCIEYYSVVMSVKRWYEIFNLICVFKRLNIKSKKKKTCCKFLWKSKERREIRMISKTRRKRRRKREGGGEGENLKGFVVDTNIFIIKEEKNKSQSLDLI